MGEGGVETLGAGDASRFLTFRVGGRLYALPADEVSEVIRLPHAARVPQSPKSLLGVANLRGSVLPLASLRALLGHEDAPWSADARAIVLDGAAPVALAVDRVDALITVDADRVETRQAEFATDRGERLRGAFQARADQPVVKILDVRSLLDADFTQRARPARARLAGGGGGLALPQAADSAPQQLLMIFEVAGQDYALDIDAVQEVLPAPSGLAHVPHAEALVLGVAAFRDTVLPLLSMRGLLGFAQAGGSNGLEKVVVTPVAGVLVGLVVDRVRSIVRADHGAVDAVPPVLAARAGGEARLKAIFRAGAGQLVPVLDPKLLFREDVMQRLTNAAEGAAPIAPLSGALVGEESQFLVFRLGDEEFGLPIEAVDEVAGAPERITRVPRTPKFLEGVINLRGDVLPVVDQRRRFDLPPFAGDVTRRRLVVVRSERHRAGLIVDSVSEVLSAATEDIEPAPDLTGESVRLVRGVVNLGERGRMILLLDSAELLSRAERGLLDKFDGGRPRA